MVKYDVENTPIVDLVNNIILVAVKSRASDIHLDPLEDGLKIRMRIDGNLQDHTILPKDSERNVITRIKLISGMNITENRLPQDGAIKGRIDNLDLDMRVSSLPTNEGEKVVVRILDYSMSLEGLNRLDFSPTNYQKVLRMTQVPNGIILVTGATGSGKSTTTYAMLQMLNKEETNIITVEDPIEMNIEGINQVQVNSEIGMTFAAALRSILRQDPNVILIGEIRDSETAQIAVRASITGHVVFSTVHTNDSLSTIERLIDMDVERYLLATALEGIISQKLARRLCPHCKKLRPSTSYEKKIFKDVLDLTISEMWEPGKCDQCINGFLGRIAIQEVLTVNDGIRDIINKQTADKDELRKMVYEENDTISLLEDGLDKVAKGFTTFEEIYKLIEVEDVISYKRKRQKEANIETQDETQLAKEEEIPQAEMPSEPIPETAVVPPEAVPVPTPNISEQPQVQPEITLESVPLTNEVVPTPVEIPETSTVGVELNPVSSINEQSEIVLAPAPAQNELPPTPEGQLNLTPEQINIQPSTQEMPNQDTVSVNIPNSNDLQTVISNPQEPEKVETSIELSPAFEHTPLSSEGNPVVVEAPEPTPTFVEPKDPQEMLADLNSIISELKQPAEQNAVETTPSTIDSPSIQENTTPTLTITPQEITNVEPAQPLKDTNEMLADLHSIIAGAKSEDPSSLI